MKIMFPFYMVVDTILSTLYEMHMNFTSGYNIHHIAVLLVISGHGGLL